MSFDILKKKDEIIFQCPYCTTQWKMSKDLCYQTIHDGMIDAVSYFTNCPECGKQVSIIEVKEKN